LIAPLKAALKKGLMDNQCANFFDLDSLRKDVKGLISAFSGIKKINHAVAVKANPIAGILVECMKLGTGAECASVVEV